MKPSTLAAATLAVVVLLGGCHRKREVATLPEVEEERAAESRPVESPPPAEPVPVQENRLPPSAPTEETLPAEAAPAESEPPDESASAENAPPAETEPVQKAAPAGPALEESAPSPQSVPEESVSPQERPAPAPRLLPSGDSPDERAIREKLTQIAELLSRLVGRNLTDEQREQADAVRAFMAQAEEALKESELHRAAVLAEKGIVLARDVESASRG